MANDKQNMPSDADTSYFTAGYLSDKAGKNVEFFNREFGSWRKLYEELNLFACESRTRLKPVKGEKLRGPFAICIWNRILDSYQCVLLLLEKGAGDEAKGMVRSILESLFLLEANTNKKTFARRYIIEDQNAVLSINKRALASSLKAERLGKNQFLSKKQRDAIRESIEHLSMQKQKREKRWTAKSRKQRRYGPWFNALAAGRKMVFEYQKSYGLLSLYTHTSVSGNLEKFLALGKGGDCNFIVGPSYEDAIPTLRLAMELLLIALSSLNRLFLLGEKVILEEYEERLRALVRNESSENE